MKKKKKNESEMEKKKSLFSNTFSKKTWKTDEIDDYF